MYVLVLPVIRCDCLHRCPLRGHHVVSGGSFCETIRCNNNDSASAAATLAVTFCSSISTRSIHKDGMLMRRRRSRYTRAVMPLSLHTGHFIMPHTRTGDRRNNNTGGHTERKRDEDRCRDIHEEQGNRRRYSNNMGPDGHIGRSIRAVLGDKTVGVFVVFVGGPLVHHCSAATESRAISDYPCSQNAAI